MRSRSTNEFNPHPVLHSGTLYIHGSVSRTYHPLAHANDIISPVQRFPRLLLVDHSPQPTFPNPIDSDMKDISISSYRSSRKVAYPKKRPSPIGVFKASKTPGGPLAPSHKSPYSAKTALLQQRQRDAQIAALRRQGVLLEEEYRDDIRFYMHEMEVRFM